MKSSIGIHKGLLRGVSSLALAFSAAGIVMFAPAASAAVLNVPHNQVMVSRPIGIPATKSTKSLSLTLSLPAGQTENVRAIGDGSITNGSKHSIIVVCTPNIDGKPAGSRYTVTVQAKSSVIVPYGFWIQAVKSGRHTVTLTAKAPGALTFNGGSLLTVGLPANDPNGALPNSAANITGSIAVGTTGFTNAIRDVLTTKTPTDIDVDGWIGLKNTSKATATVALRYGLDGKYTTAAYWASVPPGASQDIPITTNCGGATPGLHVLTEQALSSTKGIVITGGTLGGVGLPAASVGAMSPIPSAFSYGTPFTMDARAFETLVRVTNNSQGVAQIGSQTDSEMTGWVTIGNPNATPAKLTLRQTTNGAVETTDPTLVVTVGPHSQVSVPTGYISCPSMPLETDTFGVEGESSLAGLQVQVSAERATAWASPSTP